MRTRDCDTQLVRQFGVSGLTGVVSYALFGLVSSSKGLPPAHSPVHMCCVGQTLRFAMAPITYPPYFTYHENATGNAKWGGFFPAMIDAVVAEMGSAYQFVRDDGLMLGDRFGTLRNKGADVAFFDNSDPFSFTGVAASESVHTMALLDSRLGLAVLKTRREAGYWQLTKPMTPQLWGAIFLTVVLAAVIMIMLNILSPADKGNETFGQVTVDDALKFLYHMIATLFGGEDYEWVTWPGRLLRLGLLFFMLIVTATYTANLAAFFTIPEYKIHGPIDLAQLQSSTVCLVHSDYKRFVEAYVGNMVFASTDPYYTDVEGSQQACKQMLLDRKVDGWMDDISSLTSFILKDNNCESMHLVPTINVVNNQPAWMLRKENAELAFNISSALVHFKMQPPYQAILQSQFGIGRSLECSERSDEDEETMPVKLSSMWGLFFVTGCFFMSALVLASATAGMRKFSRSNRKKQELSETAMTEGEMLRLLLRKVNELSDGRSSPSRVWSEQAEASNLEI